MLLLPSCVFAQRDSEFFMGETHEFDLKEFVDNLDWESADVQAKVGMRRAGAPAPDDIRWIDRIYNLPDYMRTFYDNHGKRVQEVLNGGSNYLSNPAADQTNAVHFNNGEATFVVLKEIPMGLTFTYPQDAVDQDPSLYRQYALNAINAHIAEHQDEYLADVYDFMPYMFMSMSYDYPEAFWLRNYWNWSTSYGADWGYLQESGRDSANYTYMVLFMVQAGEYDYRNEDFRNPAVLAQAVQEYKGKVQSILADVPTDTRYAQVRYLNDWLTKHNAYNSCYDPQNSPSIVWSPMSALRGTNGERGPVCEGYARAFKVLCDQLGIPCILAVGDAIGSRDATPESHMWDEVKMNDGNWYAVDVTWNDPMNSSSDPLVSGLENENWLLLGKYDIVNKWDNLMFADSHPNSLIYGQSESAAWDYDNRTLIADYKYNHTTGVASVSAPEDDDVIYSILGVRLNKKVRELEPGVYIINGRKVVVK